MRQEYLPALEALNKSIQLNPEFAHAYLLSGLVKLRLKDSSGAYIDFNKAKGLGADSNNVSPLIPRSCSQVKSNGIRQEKMASRAAASPVNLIFPSVQDIESVLAKENIAVLDDAKIGKASFAFLFPAGYIDQVYYLRKLRDNPIFTPNNPSGFRKWLIGVVISIDSICKPSFQR